MISVEVIIKNIIIYKENLKKLHNIIFIKKKIFLRRLIWKINIIFKRW
jgi:hypothetical protein